MELTGLTVIQARDFLTDVLKMDFDRAQQFMMSAALLGTGSMPIGGGRLVVTLIRNGFSIDIDTD